MAELCMYLSLRTQACYLALNLPALSVDHSAHFWVQLLACMAIRVQASAFGLAVRECVVRQGNRQEATLVSDVALAP